MAAAQRPRRMAGLRSEFATAAAGLVIGSLSCFLAESAVGPGYPITSRLLGGGSQPAWHAPTGLIAYRSAGCCRAEAGMLLAGERVWLTRDDGGRQRPLPVELGALTQFSWGPTGARVVYPLGREVRECDIFSGRSRVVARCPLACVAVAVGPSGGTLGLLLEDEAGRQKLAVLWARTRRLRTLLESRCAEHRISHCGLTWSPDGRRLAFARAWWQSRKAGMLGGRPLPGVRPVRSQIWEAEVATAHLRRITPGPHDSWPAWCSRTGDLAFVSAGRVRIIREGGQREELPRGADDDGLAWSPDGTRLLVCRRGNLWVVPAGRKAPRLARVRCLPTGVGIAGTVSPASPADKRRAQGVPVSLRPSGESHADD
jgi:hypothetical protein